MLASFNYLSGRDNYMGKFYKDLKAGLQEALAYRKGKIKLRAEVIEIHEPPVEYRAKDVQKIRKSRQ